LKRRGGRGEPSAAIVNASLLGPPYVEMGEEGGKKKKNHQREGKARGFHLEQIPHILYSYRHQGGKKGKKREKELILLALAPAGKGEKGGEKREVVVDFIPLFPPILIPGGGEKKREEGKSRQTRRVCSSLHLPAGKKGKGKERGRRETLLNPVPELLSFFRKREGGKEKGGGGGGRNIFAAMDLTEFLLHLPLLMRKGGKNERKIETLRPLPIFLHRIKRKGKGSAYAFRCLADGGKGGKKGGKGRSRTPNLVSALRPGTGGGGGGGEGGEGEAQENFCAGRCSFFSSSCGSKKGRKRSLSRIPLLTKKRRERGGCNFTFLYPNLLKRGEKKRGALPRSFPPNICSRGGEEGGVKEREVSAQNMASPEVREVLYMEKSRKQK